MNFAKQKSNPQPQFTVTRLSPCATTDRFIYILYYNYHCKKNKLTQNIFLIKPYSKQLFSYKKLNFYNTSTPLEYLFGYRSHPSASFQGTDALKVADRRKMHALQSANVPDRPQRPLHFGLCCMRSLIRVNLVIRYGSFSLENLFCMDVLFVITYNLVLIPVLKSFFYIGVGGVEFRHSHFIKS